RLVELDRPGEALAALLLVPLPLDPPTVAREPAAGAKGEAHVHAQAEVRGACDDVLAGAADLHHRRHAAAKQLGDREVDARPRGFLVLRRAADRQELEEAGVEELRVAAVLEERAVERRAANVGVRRDELGSQDRVAGVDRLEVGPDGRGTSRADREDKVAVDDEDAVTQLAVSSAVEGDYLMCVNVRTSPDGR